MNSLTVLRTLEQETRAGEDPPGCEGNWSGLVSLVWSGGGLDAGHVAGWALGQVGPRARRRGETATAPASAAFHAAPSDPPPWGLGWAMPRAPLPCLGRPTASFNLPGQPRQRHHATQQDRRCCRRCRRRCCMTSTGQTASTTASTTAATGPRPLGRQQPHLARSTYQANTLALALRRSDCRGRWSRAFARPALLTTGPLPDGRQRRPLSSALPVRPDRGCHSAAGRGQ